MVPTKTALFGLMSSRLAWLSQRQSLLTQNVANADTPDFVPLDLSERAFQRAVHGAVRRPPPVRLAQTHPAHQAGQPGAPLGLRGRELDPAYEVAPAGNAVVIEEQLDRLSNTALDYQLTTNLYRKHTGMLRAAIGDDR